MRLSCVVIRGIDLFHCYRLIVIIVLCFSGTIVWGETSHADDWRQELGIFRIGIVGGDNPAATARRAQPFKEAVEHALKMPAEIVVSRDYAALMNAHTNGRIEYAIYTSSAYVLAWKLCECIKPLVAPKAQDGSKEFYGILLGRNTGPNSISELAGKTILFPGKDSIPAYVIPFAAREGSEPLGLSDDVVWKDESTAEQALLKFAEGSGDGLTGWSSLVGDPAKGFSRGTITQLVRSKGINPIHLRILWRSIAIPHGPHSIRTNLPKQATESLLDLLLKLASESPHVYDSIEADYSGGFAKVTHEDYQKFSELLGRFKP